MQCGLPAQHCAEHSAPLRRVGLHELQCIAASQPQRLPAAAPRGGRRPGGAARPRACRARRRGRRPRGALMGLTARAAALTAGSYACFLAAETALPFLYMPDCLASTYQLMTAEPAALQQAGAAAGAPGRGRAGVGRGCVQLLHGAAWRPAGDVVGAL